MMSKRLSENARRHIGETLTIRWGVSRGRNSYGYTTCSLRNHHGKRVAACNGGGYDLHGTVIGEWIARTFPKDLRKLSVPFTGLSWHDPSFNPGKAITADASKTVEEAEAAGESLGLDRYQAFYAASSDVPTKQHTVPLINGGCGLSSMMRILRAIGLDLHEAASTSKLDVYTITKAN